MRVIVVVAAVAVAVVVAAAAAAAASLPVTVVVPAPTPPGVAGGEGRAAEAQLRGPGREPGVLELHVAPLEAELEEGPPVAPVPCRVSRGLAQAPDEHRARQHGAHDLEDDKARNEAGGLEAVSGAASSLMVDLEADGQIQYLPQCAKVRIIVVQFASNSRMHEKTVCTYLRVKLGCTNKQADNVAPRLLGEEGPRK